MKTILIQISSYGGILNHGIFNIKRFDNLLDKACEESIKNRFYINEIFIEVKNNNDYDVINIMFSHSVFDKQKGFIQHDVTREQLCKMFYDKHIPLFYQMEFWLITQLGTSDLNYILV